MKPTLEDWPHYRAAPDLPGASRQYIRIGPDIHGAITLIPIEGDRGRISFIHVAADTDGRIISASEMFEDLKDVVGNQVRLSPELLGALDSHPDLVSAGGILYGEAFMGLAGATIMANGFVLRSMGEKDD